MRISTPLVVFIGRIAAVMAVGFLWRAIWITDHTRYTNHVELECSLQAVGTAIYYNADDGDANLPVAVRCADGRVFKLGELPLDKDKIDLHGLHFGDRFICDTADFSQPAIWTGIRTGHTYVSCRPV